jgi:hypothetical protein
MSMTDTTVANNTAQGGDGTDTGVVCDDVNHYCDGGWAYGGGVYSLNGATINSTIVRSTFASNTAQGGAVGAPVPSGAPVSGGPFGGDADGGGLFGPSSLVNSTVVDNQALAGDAPSPVRPVGVASGSARGGGISRVTLSLRSDTINGNHVDGTNEDGDGYGGANVALPPPVGTAGHVTIGETILSHGTMGEFSAPNNCLGWTPSPNTWTFTDHGSNLVSTAAADCGLGAGTGDLFGVDPKLIALASNGGPTQTEALGTGSPALGAVDSNGFCQFVDQRGLPRPDTRCDIGAYQHQQPPPPPPAPPGVPAQSLVLNSNGTLGVKVSCPGPSACIDLIQLTTTRIGTTYTYRVYGGSRTSTTTYRVVLASRRVTIGARHTATVTLVAPLRARRLIRAHPRGLRVTIRVSNLGNHLVTNRRSIIRPHR